MRCLILTVGGSCTPIVTSIRKNKPDRVIFLCSDDTDEGKGSYHTVDGEGMPCQVKAQPNQPSIVAQTDLSHESYEVIKLSSCDDLSLCYTESLQAIQNVLKQHPDSEVIIDYTGGTKSMSVGLATAALDLMSAQAIEDRIKFCIVAGSRVDLIKVQDGTQTMKRLWVDRIRLDRDLNRIEVLFRNYDYDSIIEIVDRLCATLRRDESEERKMQNYRTVSMALKAWDSFDHAQAWKILHPHRKRYTELVMFLEAVIHSRAVLDPAIKEGLTGLRATTPGHGYEAVSDLRLNAERRVNKGRYDDAVARLYRALELLVQLRLKLKFDISTGDIKPDQLPENLRDEYQPDSSGKIRVGLTKAYELLGKLSPEDPVSKLYKQNANHLKFALETRNQSLMAHGFSSVSEADFKKINEYIDQFLGPCLKKLSAGKKLHAKPIQFPTELPT